MKNNIAVKLKSFKGTLLPEEDVSEKENYWKLIGETGKVIDDLENNHGSILILFDKDLDAFNIENHNPIKNSLWIGKTDLDIVIK